MSFAADLDLKERIRSSVDIVDLIGGQMELRRQGRNFVARCPWHDDRRPSLMINQERQTWRCWVCDIGGDIFSYVMKRDGVSFPEALQLLGEMAGIPADQLRSSKPVKPGSKDDKQTLLAAMRWAVQQYAKCFSDSPLAEPARAYAASRGISAESIEKFKIGFAPDEWDWLLKRGKSEGYDAEILEACGLAKPRRSGGGYYDMFRNRLLFPIFDLQGRPISIGGRVLPGGEGHGGKYINGPETALFSKSKQLYGLNWARDAIVRDREALVMEGYTDVLGAVQAGIDSAVAVLGTALGSEHIRILQRFADAVVLILDGDQAGQRRADEVLELFVSADVDLRILTLPDGLDPADYITQYGAEALRAAVEQAPDAIEHKLRRLVDGIDLATETHRATKALEAMLAVLAKIPPGNNELRLQQTLLRLARTFAAPLETLERQLGELRKKNRRPKREPRRGPSVPSDSPKLSKPAKGDVPPDSVVDSWIGEEHEDPFGGFAPPDDIFTSGVATPGHTAAGTHASDMPPAAFAQPTDKITGVDRDLFELLIEAPQFAAHAVEDIDPNWLESDSARQLLAHYQAQELAGLSLDLSDLLLTIENESLKNQVVAMDSRVQVKEGASNLTHDARYASIVERYREIDTRAETQQLLSKLDQGLVPDEEQLDLLDELFAAQRVRQGLTGQHDQDS